MVFGREEYNLLTLPSQLNGIEFPKSSVSRLDSVYVSQS